MNDTYFFRYYAIKLASELKKPFVHILFGARQTGKTFLLKHLVPQADLWYNLADPVERNRHLIDPSLFLRECRALPAQSAPLYVVVDEAQLVPAIFDAIQVLYDSDKNRWRFILCGSSARKLRSTGVNLLPGRSLLHRLTPLTLYERHPSSGAASSRVIPLDESSLPQTIPLFPAADLEERLAFGELPGIVLQDESDRGSLLASYTALHLEEEIRRETTVRNWAAFVNFLRLAALHSGEMINYTALSRQTGVSITAIKSHYQLLEDMFIGFCVPGFSGSGRKSLLSTPRFFFFDLGVRHAAAGLEPGRTVVAVNPGAWFEQWVALEIHKRLLYMGSGRLFYLRSKSGMEIDLIIERNGSFIPVEVKWTEAPNPSDARHLRTFLSEYQETAHGYIICRCPRPQAISKSITALPWWML